METEIILMRCNNRHAGFKLSTFQRIFPKEMLDKLKAGVIINSEFQGKPAQLEYIKDIGSCLVYQMVGKIPIL